LTKDRGEVVGAGGEQKKCRWAVRRNLNNQSAGPNVGHGRRARKYRNPTTWRRKKKKIEKQPVLHELRAYVQKVSRKGERDNKSQQGLVYISLTLSPMDLKVELPLHPV
jgi:hypothetical protein